MADPTAVTGGEREGKAVTGGSASLPDTQGRTPGTQQGHLGCHSTRAFHTFVVTTPSTKTRRDKEMGKKKVSYLALSLNIPARAAPAPAARGCEGTSPGRTGQPWNGLGGQGSVGGGSVEALNGAGGAPAAPAEPRSGGAAGPAGERSGGRRYTTDGSLGGPGWGEAM